MRFVGRGHEAIRATHDKTLEFVPGAGLTERGTCIVAVQAAAEPPRPAAGPVTITITAAGESFELDAVANPSWDPRGPAVVRRSALRLPGTLATEADAAARDLPRNLVAALQDPGATVTVEVVRRSVAEPAVVLFLADPGAASDARLDAELAVADTVLAEDPDALRLIGRHTARPGGRTLVVATRGLPGRTALGAIAAATRIETVGLPPVLAAAAASPARGPLTLAEPDDAVRTVRDLLRRTPAVHRLVLAVGADEVDALLAEAAIVRGTTTATIAQDFAPPQRVSGEDRPPLHGSGTVHVCLPAATGDDALDPGVRASVTALLADGVSTRTAAQALAALTGWERRRAYDAVLALRPDRSS